MQDFKKKYFKYKAKYLKLKDLLKGGDPINDIIKEQLENNYGEKEWYKDKSIILELKSKSSLLPDEETMLKKAQVYIKPYEDFQTKKAKKNCHDNTSPTTIIGCTKGILYGYNFDEKLYRESLENIVDTNRQLRINSFDNKQECKLLNNDNLLYTETEKQEVCRKHPNCKWES